MNSQLAIGSFVMPWPQGKLSFWKVKLHYLHEGRQGHNSRPIIVAAHYLSSVVTSRATDIISPPRNSKFSQIATLWSHSRRRVKRSWTLTTKMSLKFRGGASEGRRESKGPGSDMGEHCGSVQEQLAALLVRWLETNLNTGTCTYL